MNNLEKLLQKKQGLLNELDKIYELIAIEKIQLQDDSGGIGRKSPAIFDKKEFEKRVRAKFRIK